MNGQTLPLVNWLDDYLLEENAKHGKKEQTTWYASSLGNCLRGVYFERLGIKPDSEFDARTLRIFKMGRLVEEWYRDRMLTEKIKQVGGKLWSEVYVRDENELGVSGYADAVVEHNNKREVLEIKSVNKDSYRYIIRRGGAKDNHKMQLWIYLYLLKTNYGKIVYINKSYMDIAEFIVRRDDEQLAKKVKSTLAMLNEAWEKKDPSILPLEDDWRAKYCRWHSHCLKIEKK